MRKPRLFYWETFLKEIKDVINDIDSHDEFGIFLISIHDSIESYLTSVKKLNELTEELSDEETDEFIEFVDDKYDKLGLLVENAKKELKTFQNKKKKTNTTFKS